VLFGATGDLARRMLWASLYALDDDGLLPADFRVVGAAHSQGSDDDFRAKVHDAIRSSADAALFDDAGFERFARRIAYVSVDAHATGGLRPPAAALADVDARPTVLYLSTAPHLFGPICRALAVSGPYGAGTWGPSAAIGLPERHGHSWHE
jgi:glucose-6-phosphate 1-dehydrogenase